MALDYLNLSDEDKAAARQARREQDNGIRRALEREHYMLSQAPAKDLERRKEIEALLAEMGP